MDEHLIYEKLLDQFCWTMTGTPSLVVTGHPEMVAKIMTMNPAQVEFDGFLHWCKEIDGTTFLVPIRELSE